MSCFMCPECGAGSEFWFSDHCLVCGYCQACEGTGCGACVGEDRGRTGFDLLTVMEMGVRPDAAPAERSKTFPALEAFLPSL